MADMELIKIEAYWWLLPRRFQNIGEIPGLEVIRYMGFSTEFFCGKADLCLLSVGSELDRTLWSKISVVKDVWGSGANTGKSFRLDGSYRFHAVRGSLTRDFLGLPKAIPLGDSVLLLPQARALDRGDEGMVYVTHFFELGGKSNAAMALLGADVVGGTKVSVKIWEKVARIVRSSLVMISPLHGAIIARAYGVPSALFRPQKMRDERDEKLWNWFSYLGVQGQVDRNVKEGWRWWEFQGKPGQVFGFEELEEAFP